MFDFNHYSYRGITNSPVIQGLVAFAAIEGDITCQAAAAALLLPTPGRDSSTPDTCGLAACAEHMLHKPRSRERVAFLDLS